MGSKGGFILLGLLLILSVVCHSGHSLRCYTCINPGGKCTSAQNCTSPSNACLHVQAETREYYSCWNLDNCKYSFLAQHFNEKTLKYKCCQMDLCNSQTRITGTTVLLVTQLLAAFWRIFI